MADVTAAMVKELRERTQAGMSDCKSALVETAGDMEKAVEVILKKGLAKSAKRAGAAATEGEVRAHVEGGKLGVLVEVNSQTDFVARNDDFKAFVGNVVTVAMGTADGEDIGAKPYPGSDKTVEQFRAALAGTIGENIQVRRFARFEREGAGFVTSYVHLGGKIGVLLEIGAETPAVAEHAAVKSFAEDVAMQIAAMSPLFVEKTQVSADAVAKQVEIFQGQLKEEGKPEAAWPKIIEGKKVKWFTEVCLLDQESVVTPGSSIDKLRAEVSKAAGGLVTVRRFVRFERGEGIEKKQDDFAAEVAKMAGGLARTTDVASVRVRLAAVSVDLDEIPCYHAIHGLPAPQGSGSSVVYDVALGRALDWARSQGLPLTLFAVGADMARGESAARLREAAEAGHEIGNHTLEHRYDLVRLDAGEMRRQVFAGADVLAGATGQRPVGFRAPGYTVTDALLEVVAESGATYDASVFPCPSYLAAKGAALGAIAARGRASRSILGDPRVALAPTTPYRLGRPFYRPGGGLREIPIQVTSIARLPIIGTSLVLAPASVASVLVRGALGEPTFNLELHGIDFVDQTDGLAELARHQPDLRVPWETKIARLDAAVDAVRAEGFAFVTMETLAVRVLS